MLEVKKSYTNTLIGLVLLAMVAHKPITVIKGGDRRGDIDT